MEGYRISEVAEMTKLSMDTIRFYEKIGLIPVAKKNSRGYKEYTESDVQYITFIVNLKRTEMSLATMQDYISAYNHSNIDLCFQLLEEHATKVESQIDERKKVLQTIQYKLKHFKELEGGGKKMNITQETIQTPISSGYGPRTTAEEALAGMNLSGKTVIVTGGYSGLGLETTRVLAQAGAKVIVPARIPEKAKAALKNIPGVELETLDLVNPKSIDAFAQRFISSSQPLDILVNAAGIMAVPLSRNEYGYESQFATNHLGHFQLTARLFPALVMAKGARVVSVSSRGHRISELDFLDPNFLNRPYDKWKAYGQSKTANALFALELDRLGKKYGVRAFSVHPGTIVTDLSRNLTDEEMRSMGALDDEGNRILSEYNDEFKTIEEGAATIVWCAVSKQLEGKGGVYCENVDIAQAVSNDCHKGPGVWPWATDIEEAKRLWVLSEELTKVKFLL